MTASTNLLDKFKKSKGISSDNACAIALDISRSTVSLWRNEKGHPEADSVAAMCDAINEPLRQWLPLIEAERARTPAVRKVWLRLAQATAALTLTFGLLNVQTVQAQGISSFSHNPGAVYIMSIMKQLFRTAGTYFADAWNLTKKYATNEFQVEV